MIPKLIGKSTLHSNATYTKHLPLEFLVGRVLVGVNPCGRCAVVALLPRTTKLPNKMKKIHGFNICKVI